MRRFLLFAGYNYYPCGGVDDLHSLYDTEKEALHATVLDEIQQNDWWHILDIQTGEVVARSED